MSNQTTVRPFRVGVLEEDLVELRRRVEGLGVLIGVLGFPP